MTKLDVDALFAYSKWANDRMLANLRELSEEQFTRALGGSFSSIRDTAAHIVAGEWVWLRRWTGTNPTAMPDWAKAPSFPELAAKFVEIEAERAAFLRSLTDADLARPLAYILFSGQHDSQPLQAQLQHIVNHSSYHRGQVATMLRQVGAKPTGTDFITYCREKSAQQT